MVIKTVKSLILVRYLNSCKYDNVPSREIQGLWITLVSKAVVHTCLQGSQFLPLCSHTILPFVEVPLCPTPTLLDLSVSGSLGIRIEGEKQVKCSLLVFYVVPRTINHVAFQLSSERRAQSCDASSSRWRAKEHMSYLWLGRKRG
jgi:hypothetical protein